MPTFESFPTATQAIRFLCVRTILGLVSCFGVAGQSLNADEISFSRDILPVLSDRCFHCHGPDEQNREADLRLDVEEAAKRDLGGYVAISPGSLDDSEIWRRISTDDESEVMPPADSHRKPLSPSEKQLIGQWILAGADWGKHWSFEKPARPAVPSGEDHPIDAFVANRLAEHGLRLSESAPAETQLRRLALDLTGLSPDPEMVRGPGDGAGEGFEAAVDRLLASPHHAERMAMWWLDAARYSDSDGFQQDSTRQNWPWRDWVIEQFRQNRSFKDFTIEQFAGDLLPNATDQQKLATCFHRNHMTNGEGGRDPEESRIDYVIDRVNTTGTVWLGLTLGCVQCHSHKFDPISQHDYYSLTAFFNSIDEDGKAGMSAKPYLKYASPMVEARINELEAFVETCRTQATAQRELATKRFDAWLRGFRKVPPEDYSVWRVLEPIVHSSDGTQFAVEPNRIVQARGPLPRQDDYRVVLTMPKEITRVTGVRLEVFPNTSHVKGAFTRDGTGDFTLTSVRALGRRRGSPSEEQLEISRAIADFEADKDRKTSWDRRYGSVQKTLNDDARDGWTTEAAKEIEPHVAVFELARPWTVEAGDQFIFMLRHRSTHGHANIGRFRVTLSSELGDTVRRVDGSSPRRELLESMATDSIDNPLRKRLLAQFLLDDGEYQQVASRLAEAERQLKELKREVKPRSVMVLAAREKPRDTHVLVRGVWDAKGDIVRQAVLPAILDWPAEKTQSRLELAQWLVDDENPLTARVVVNHLWQIMFGNGLVRTPGDFGLQGERPTHPKLLDWLAVELIEHDWDLRHLLRLIATSKTYRQSSSVTPELLERDPENRLLARAPRFRLPAWMIRDNALRVSGLLNPALGGPPVKPFQPAGVWSEITMGRFKYRPSLGPAQYRRTVYAFWRRSSAPTFLFDSAQRRVCEVGVRRTNTPLHALTLMNDVTMLEASRALADLVINDEAAKSCFSETNALLLARRVLSRSLRGEELGAVERVWTSSKKHFQDDLSAAIEYCSVGQHGAPKESLVADTAAWMSVASLLLNLDEAMTRE